MIGFFLQKSPMYVSDIHEPPSQQYLFLPTASAKMAWTWNSELWANEYCLLEIVVPFHRTVLNKERLAGYYRLSAYYLAKVSIDVVLTAVLPLVFVTTTFWVGGLSLDFLVYAQYILSVLLMSVAALVSELPLKEMQMLGS